MDDLTFWGPVVVLIVAGFVTGQRARECRTPEGIARERAAARRWDLFAPRFRPCARDFTPEGQRYWRVAAVCQSLTVAFVVLYTVYAITR